MPKQPEITRRQLIWLASCVAFTTIVACGGGGAGIIGGGNADTKDVTTSLVLPSGAQSKDLVFLSGFSEIANPGSASTATVLKDTPTLCSVINPTTKRVMMLGMLDPDSGLNKIDAKNVAATLLFLAVGASQSTAKRKDAWASIYNDPATLALSLVIQTRLAADNYALENGDNQIIAAIAVAIAALDYLHPHFKPASKALEGEPKAMVDSAPLPASVLDFGAGIVTNGTTIDYARRTNGLRPDYFEVRHETGTEITVYAYETAGPDGTPLGNVKKAAGPLQVAPVQDSQTLVVTDPTPLSLQTATDDRETMHFVILRPIYDAPVPALFSDQAYLLQTPTWTADLIGMWRRASVHIAARLFLEADGVGGRAFTVTEMKQMVTTVSGIDLEFLSAVNASDGGHGLPATVAGINALAAQNDQNAQSMITALRPLVPGLDSASAARLVQIRGTQRIYNSLALVGFATQFGPLFLAHQYSGTSNNAPTAEQTDPVIVDKVKFSLTPAGVSYQPGTPLSISVESTPDYVARFADIIRYHWKLVGSGTIADSSGHSGQEFDSTRSFVNLTAQSGPQTVSVEVFNIQNGTPYSISTMNVTLNP